MQLLVNAAQTVQTTKAPVSSYLKMLDIKSFLQNCGFIL